MYHQIGLNMLLAASELSRAQNSIAYLSVMPATKSHTSRAFTLTFDASRTPAYVGWRRHNDPPVFETVIRQANQIAAAAELQTSRRTLKQKDGYGDLATRYIDLAQELLDKPEIDA